MSAETAEHEIINPSTGSKTSPKNTINNPKKHHEIITKLKEPFFGLYDLLKDKSTLTPQQVAEIWGNPELHEILHNFPVNQGQAKKHVYLNKHPKLKISIEKTRQILQKQEQSKQKEQDTEQDPEDILSELDNQNPKSPKLKKTEDKPMPLNPETFLKGLGAENFATENTELLKILSDSPKIQTVLNGLNTLSSKNRIAALKANKKPLTAIVKSIISKENNVKIKSTKKERKITKVKNEINLSKSEKNITQESHKNNKEKIQSYSEHLKNMKDNLTLSEIQNLLASPDLNNPEFLQNKDIAGIKGQLQKIQSEMGSVASVATKPEEQQALSQLVNSSPVAWQSGRPTVRYASLLGGLKSNPVFSEQTIAAVHQQLGISYHPKPTVKNGDDIKSAITRGRGTEKVTKSVRRKNPETGEWETVQETAEEPLSYDEDNPLEIRAGVQAYEKNGKTMLRAKSQYNSVEIDITNALSSHITDIAEQMAFWSLTENAGATGFVEDNLKINFSFFNSNFDSATLKENKRIINYMFGGFEGSDGAIMNPDEKKSLLLSQVRILTRTGKSLGGGSALGAYNQEETTKNLQKLGLRDENGNINDDVFSEFGRYTQTNHQKGSIDLKSVQNHLNKVFPDLVKPFQKI